MSARAALLLVDLQQDFLARESLQPGAASVVTQAARLLAACRGAGIPVFHAHTQVRADGADAMPHWRSSGALSCVAGTAGAQPPPELAPAANELRCVKTHYSAFEDGALAPALRAAGVTRVIIAGLYTHACVRSTALDAYRSGFEVRIARDAIASAEPEHAQLTLAWLKDRAATCVSVDEIVSSLGAAPAPRRVWVQRNPARWDEVLGEAPLAGAQEVQAAAQRAQQHATAWACVPDERHARLQRWREALAHARDALIAQIVREVGKPLTDATAECDYALALIDGALGQGTPTGQSGAGWQTRQQPLGAIALITPWNNPLAIAVGKLAPALMFGNTVVWKPALPAIQVSRLVMQALAQSGLGDAVTLLSGDADSARLLLAQPQLRAVSFTGSVAAGQEVAALCARHGKKLQAEMGGNNALLVLDDCDAQALATPLARALYSFAGQRCTAPRRVIATRGIAPRLTEALVSEIRRLKIGEPSAADTQVGPLISRDAQARMAALTNGARTLCGGGVPAGWEHGCWFLPTLIADAEPDSVLVQEEAFGPVAVLQVARDFDQAMVRCNGVRHGLVATLYSHDEALQRRFLDEAQAGILTLNRGPIPIAPEAAFGGWKESGIGAPEHGRWDLEFYTRPQTIYSA